MTQGFRPYLLLTFLCAILFLPGLTAIPPTDRDEARFMQATKQMLESGDWVHIRFQAEPRNKKPVGIYWMQAAAVKILGQDHTIVWPYRLPSVLGAWLAVLAACWAGGRLFGPAAGLLAGGALATTFIVVVEAHIAKTDAMLLGTTTIALAMLGRLYTLRDSSVAAALVFWIALGVGILIKGPLIILVAGTAVATLAIADRDARWLKSLRPLLGVPLALVIVLPWLIAVSDGGGSQGSFLNDALRQDLLPKLIGGQESHGAPPGTYLAAALLTAWPWSVLAPFVLIAAWKRRGEPAVRFCLAWLIPTWIVFELVPTKLPHYTMPLYPAFALLLGAALTQWSEAQDFQRWVGRAPGLAYRIAWASFAVALGVGIVMVNRLYGDGTALGAGAAAITAAAAGGIALIGFARSTVARNFVGLAAVSVAFCFALTAGVLPHLRAFAVSPRIAAAVSQHRPLQESPAPVALTGFHEPSAVFLLGTDTILTDTAGAAAHIIASPGALAVVPDSALDDVGTALAAQGRSMIQVEALTGYNYSRGDWLRLVLVKSSAP